MRHDRRLHDIIEGRMGGKPTRWGKIQMLHDLANGGDYDALKRAAMQRTWKDGDKTAAAAISVIFVTKIKTRTRIIGRRFQRTRTRIIVIQKTKTK